MRLLSRSAFVITLTAFLSTIICYIVTHPIPVILMFHSITHDRQDSPHVSPVRFRTFIKAIQRRDEPIELTTDSSDASIYNHFFSVLREYGLTATIFILPLVVESKGMLTWDQIREMDQAGFTIGSHTLRHPWLPDLTDEEISHELCQSKVLIEREVGHPITTLAYPYGAFDQRVKQLARKCGYTQAYTTAPGRRFPDNDPLALKRVYVSETALANPALESLALSGFYITARELALFFLPIEVPRRPEE
ncbi:MAG: polysaccharide deacetylase family protein [Nitrospiraceae bacterium]